MSGVTIRTWANGEGWWRAAVVDNGGGWVTEDVARALAFVAIEAEIKARRSDDVLHAVRRLRDLGEEGHRWVFTEAAFADEDAVGGVR